MFQNHLYAFCLFIHHIFFLKLVHELPLDPIDNGVKTLKGQVQNVSKKKNLFPHSNTYLPDNLQNLMDFKWIKNDPYQF